MIWRRRALRQIEPGIADRIVDAVDVERVLHDAVADTVTPAGAVAVAEQDDLGAVELDPG